MKMGETPQGRATDSCRFQLPPKKTIREIAHWVALSQLLDSLKAVNAEVCAWCARSAHTWKLHQPRFKYCVHPGNFARTSSEECPTCGYYSIWFRNVKAAELAGYASCGGYLKLDKTTKTSFRRFRMHPEIIPLRCCQSLQYRMRSNLIKSYSIAVSLATKSSSPNRKQMDIRIWALNKTHVLRSGKVRVEWIDRTRPNVSSIANYISTYGLASTGEFFTLVIQNES